MNQESTIQQQFAADFESLMARYAEQGYAVQISTQLPQYVAFLLQQMGVPDFQIQVDIRPVKQLELQTAPPLTEQG